MLYRIRLDLAFSDIDPADDIIDKVKDHIAEAITINPGEKTEEPGFASLEQCYHDEDPTSECVILCSFVTPL